MKSINLFGVQQICRNSIALEQVHFILFFSFLFFFFFFSLKNDWNNIQCVGTSAPALKMQLHFVYFINWYLRYFKEFKFYVENHKLPWNIQAALELKENRKGTAQGIKQDLIAIQTLKLKKNKFSSPSWPLHHAKKVLGKHSFNAKSEAPILQKLNDCALSRCTIGNVVGWPIAHSL